MDTPTLIENTEIPGLGARRRARRRYFWLALAIAIVGLIDNIVFLIWRHDKPLHNPGGPLAEMGAGVVFWELSGRLLMWVACFILLCGQVLNQRASSSK